ncbi:50S ribosomal protein L5 [candidate division WWE3 bacterium RIFCSPHIGHO2_01_FULL_40_23]|uniref:Large ribosomal subunit protein uL5 n=1 Tax=candidate division WWE3 bacterium RIFCSPLOWO2_01_FULL_41_18 TaxID=1802625 RepID=A0A1F4VDD0_UNCKA|nr:MAG: 50S ribosomal protein L5 [candidate division WWE3 bacterium RIFCSPHIGHO2_01_FULL_40_23]OGC55159.1 MAG: 50S ribosomal protein L5 [candidate division WWE3 bacterium RIFCSPLOWO2_01_FULL_41_18]
MEARLKEKYKNQILKELSKELGRKNHMSLPKIKKVVVNMGIGRFKDDKGLIATCEKEFALICGQKPRLRSAKKSISNFKVRQGDVIGMSATLRGDKMWVFLDKLLNIVLPRVRDFRGVSKKAFDGNGNYTLGLKEHTVFPEINPNTVDKIKSLEVTIATSGGSNEETYLLLSKLGMPFEK